MQNIRRAALYALMTAMIVAILLCGLHIVHTLLGRQREPKTLSNVQLVEEVYFHATL